MCITCGCSETKPSQHDHGLQKHDHKQHSHLHEHSHPHRDGENIILETAILAENEQFAKQNRNFFAQKKTTAFNLLSSPGSGKTTLLEATIKSLKNKYPLYVIEGDQHTELDASRIRASGAIAHQINTGNTCHLDAHMIAHALEHLTIEDNGFIFIENVGNLICPALFDLGEIAKIVIISVTEGEDKPLKYPGMFKEADLVIINKIDLLAYVPFSITKCIENIKKINAKCEILQLSALKQDGMEKWLNWLDQSRSNNITSDASN